MPRTLVLSLEILQTQVCSECSKYLTVLPITQLKDGQILCGRKDCLQKNTTPSLVNTLLASFQFVCVNYLDGCRKSLTSETCKIHEKTCLFNPHECFFCSYKGNWTQLLYHIKTEHPSNITQVCRFSFEVGANSSQVFLYVSEDGDLYLVSVTVSSEKLKVSITIPNTCDIKIKLTTFKFYLNPDFNNQMDTLIEYDFFNSRSNNCFDKSMEELAFCFYLGAKLTCHIAFHSLDISLRELELKKKDIWLKELMKSQANRVTKKQKSLDDLNSSLQFQKNNLEGIYTVVKQIIPKVFCCRHCDIAINDDAVFICANGHSYCKDCVPRECKTSSQSEDFYQNKSCMDFERIEGLSKIYLNCEWADCNESISLPRYIDHKRTCSQRPFVCPVIKCFIKMYSSKALVDHWHSNLKLETNDSLIINEYGVYNLFWLIDNDLYKVYVDFQRVSVMVDIEALNIAFKMLKFRILCNFKDSWSPITLNKTYSRNTYEKQVFMSDQIKINDYVLDGYPKILKICILKKEKENLKLGVPAKPSNELYRNYDVEEWSPPKPSNELYRNYDDDEW